MTDREERQHVIEVLQKMVDWMESINYIVVTPERRRALEYAIASIKTEADKPTTKENLAVDAVSRAEVLKLMQDNWHTHNGDWAMQESMDDIRALPSVTPIRPKGHWIEHEESISTAFKHLRECSCCKCYFDWLMPRNSYCPNCGSKMLEPQESEDKE